MLYEKFEKHWKIWLWIPIILLVLSVGVIASNIATKGSFMERDIELTGGKSITFEVASVDVDVIKSQLPYAKVHVRLIEVRTGQILYSEEGEGEAFSEAGTVFGVGAVEFVGLGPCLVMFLN